MRTAAEQRLHNQQIRCALREADATDFRNGQAVDVHPVAWAAARAQWGTVVRACRDGVRFAVDVGRTRAGRPRVVRLHAANLLPPREDAVCPACGFQNPPHVCPPRGGTPS